MIDQCSQDQYVKNLEIAKKCELKKDSKGCCCSQNLFVNFYEAPAEEHEKIIKKIDEQTNLIICLGLGFGMFYLSAKKWLEKDKSRRLVFIEESYFPVDHFLKSSAAEGLLTDSQVKIYLLEGEPFIFKKIAWENVGLKAEIVINPFALLQGKNRFLEIKDQIYFYLAGVNAVLNNCVDYGVLHFGNVFKNLRETPYLKLTSSLKDSFKNIPALICGAGASAKNKLESIKVLEKKAIIFSGGAGVNILLSGNVHPHFAANLDKIAPKERFDQIKELSIPHFVQMQMSNENYHSLSSEKILIPPGESYPLEFFLYEQLGLDQPLFETGWTVGSAMIAVASYLGCDPIIFIGLDFCYKDQKYPQDIPYHHNQSAVIETVDVLGNKVFSQKDWFLAKDWIEDFVKERKDICFINASGGILSKEICSMELEEVVDKVFRQKEEIDIPLLVQSKVSSSKKIILSEVRVKKIIADILASIERCLTFLRANLSNIESLFLSKNFSFKGLEEEPFYCFHLLPLWNIFSGVIVRDVISREEEVDFELAVFINKLIFCQGICQKFIDMISKL